jgi:hypothetical protein
MKNLLTSIAFLLALTSMAQTTRERMSSQEQVYFIPIEKIPVLVILEPVDGIDFETLGQREFREGTEFSAPLEGGSVGGSVACVEFLDQDLIDKINQFAYEMVKPYIPVQLVKASENVLDPEQSQFYVMPQIKSSQQQPFILGRNTLDALNVSFNVSVGIFENRPGKLTKTIHFNGGLIVIRQSYPTSTGPESPTLEAYKKVRREYADKIDKNLEKIAQNYQKKLPKKLTK